MLYDVQRTHLMQFADNAGIDQPAHLRCSPTESMNIVVHVDEQRMHRSDCAGSHTDLDLRCSRRTFRTLYIIRNQWSERPVCAGHALCDVGTYVRLGRYKMHWSDL